MISYTPCWRDRRVKFQTYCCARLNKRCVNQRKYAKKKMKDMTEERKRNDEKQKNPMKIRKAEWIVCVLHFVLSTHHATRFAIIFVTRGPFVSMLNSSVVLSRPPSRKTKNTTKRIPGTAKSYIVLYLVRNRMYYILKKTIRVMAFYSSV